MLTGDGARTARALAAEAGIDDVSAEQLPDDKAAAVTELVRNNLVIALLPPAVIPDGDDLRTISVTSGPTRVEYLAWSGFNASPAAEAFLDGLAVTDRG